MLVEEEHALGGHLRWGDEAELAPCWRAARPGRRPDGIEVLTDSVVTGRYDDNWVAVVQRLPPGTTERLVKARAKTLVVAPGLIERPYVFAGNDLPGVMLSTAVRRLINLYAVRPGERAVVLTANAEGDAAVADLERAGVEVAHVVDARRGERLVRAHRPQPASRAVELADGSGIDCDLLVTAIGWTAPTSLLNMAGDRPVYDPARARFFPTGRCPTTCWPPAGSPATAPLDELVAHAEPSGGRRRGGQPAGQRPGATPVPVAVPARLPVEAHPGAVPGLAPHGIVDFSEDVSSKDMRHRGRARATTPSSWSSGTPPRPWARRRASWRPSTPWRSSPRPPGDTIEETGTTVWRPPYAPITLGALAGRLREPHAPLADAGLARAHGARPRWSPARGSGPTTTATRQAEALAVRERVGIIDVTPLGKLDLRGPDVPKLLEPALRQQVVRSSTSGRVRYGVMCAEDGVVLDDGVTGRLGDRALPDDHDLLRRGDGVGVGRELAADRAPGLAGARHAGDHRRTPASTSPGRARASCVGRLVDDDIDLTPEAFPYMNVRTGRWPASPAA